MWSSTRGAENRSGAQHTDSAKDCMARTRLRRSHAGHAVVKLVAIDRVAVPYEPLRCGVIWEGLNDLLCGPGGGQMLGDRDVNDAPALVGKQD